jgi:hypothetical protein
MPVPKAFLHVKHNATIALGRYLPLQLQVKVFECFIGHDVAAVGRLPAGFVAGVQVYAAIFYLLGFTNPVRLKLCQPAKVLPSNRDTKPSSAPDLLVLQPAVMLRAAMHKKIA